MDFLIRRWKLGVGRFFLREKQFPLDFLVTPFLGNAKKVFFWTWLGKTVAMNAGRLHAVLEEIKQDYEKHDVVARIQAAVNALSTSIGSISETNAIAFTNALRDLYAALDQSPLNLATPSQMEILKEIGANDKVGLGLRSVIQRTLDTNNVTPANALAELQRILEVVGHLAEVVTHIVEGFEALKIPYDRLEPGESEIGVLVPWPVIDSNLSGLEKELHQFDRALRFLGELVGDNPQSPEIRAVGSSLFELFLNSTPALALCVATALERLCALYKQILEIKSLRKQLNEKNLPKDATAQIEAHEQLVAEKEIGKIVEDLIREFGKKKDKERLNELRTGLRSALRFFAEQIDAGVDMEVRSEPPRPKDVAEVEGEDVKSDKTKRALDEARRTATRIQRAGVAMRTLDRTGEPILALSFPEEEEKKKVRRKATRS